jgi:hypothetical protein
MEVEMVVSSTSAFLFAKPAELAIGRVVLTPEGPQPYKVAFRLGDRTLSEHPVATVREGEALIRRELAGVQFSALQERPNPEAPPRRLSSVTPAATD